MSSSSDSLLDSPPSSSGAAFSATAAFLTWQTIKYSVQSQRQHLYLLSRFLKFLVLIDDFLVLSSIIPIPPVPLHLPIMTQGWLTEFISSKIGAGELGSNLARPVQAILLLVSHCTTVLTSTLPVLGGDLGFVHTPVVPLGDCGELSDFFLLLPLVLQSGALGVEVPGGITDVLRDVWVDVFPVFVDRRSLASRFPRLLQLLCFSVLISILFGRA